MSVIRCHFCNRDMEVESCFTVEDAEINSWENTKVGRQFVVDEPEGCIPEDWGNKIMCTDCYTLCVDTINKLRRLNGRVKEDKWEEDVKRIGDLLKK